MRKVWLHPAASADVDAIADYTIETWGSGQARKYMTALQQDMTALAEAVLRHPVHEPSGLGLRYARSGRHVIFYLTTSDTVEIVRIMHERVDASARLRQSDESTGTP